VGARLNHFPLVCVIYVVIRYNRYTMYSPHPDYFRLSEFRFQLRRFLHSSQSAATEAHLHPQQHQLLLTILGMPKGESPTIVNVARHMILRHNSAVELVDRCIKQGLLLRHEDPDDRRRILLEVTPAGEEIMQRLSEFHLRQLEVQGPELIRSLQNVLAPYEAGKAVKTAESSKR
jgi:DNA-binding MarR family transcriptional regulator